MKLNNNSTIQQYNNCKSRGFTLVELLASIIVLVAVGSVIAGIITSSLRGSNKTNTVENIRQNGNYVLNQMSKNIQYAETFNGLSNDDSSDRIYTTNCPESFSLTPTPIPEVKYKYIKATPLNSSPIIYNCTSVPPTLTADGTPLIDDSVTLTECKITCTQARSTDVPIIGISFTLKPKIQNSLVENSTPPILFKTSVTIRNYKE